MANLFGSTKGRDDNDPIKKLQVEIEGTEYRKQVLITCVQNEIQAERQKINNELYQIGVDVYENSANVQDVTEKIKAHISAIESYKKLIADKEGKIMEISRRYDEEVGILRTQMSMYQSPVPQPYFSPGARCPSCGASYTPGVHLFCDGCGYNLSMSAAGGPPPAGPPVDQPAYPPATFCGNCGTVYTPGKDMFCKNCGQRF